MRAERIAILGGSGFLGQSLVSTWSKKSKKSFFVCDLQRPAVNEDVEFKKINILDVSSINQALEEADIIINLTGQLTKPMDLSLKLNSIGIHNLCQSLKPSQHLIQISTTSVYGSHKHADENSLLSPETTYGAAKTTAEFLIQCSLKAEQATILRLPNLYGPNQLKGILAYLLRSNSSDHILNFDNDGSLLRYYLHTEDCANLIEFFLNHPKAGVFNLPGEGPYSIHQLIQIAEESFECRFTSYFKEIPPPDNIQTLSCDRLKDQFDFQLNSTISDFLRFKD